MIENTIHTHTSPLYVPQDVRGKTDAYMESLAAEFAYKDIAFSISQRVCRTSHSTIAVGSNLHELLMEADYLCNGSFNRLFNGEFYEYDPDNEPLHFDPVLDPIIQRVDARRTTADKKIVFVINEAVAQDHDKVEVKIGRPLCRLVLEMVQAGVETPEELSALKIRSHSVSSKFSKEYEGSQRHTNPFLPHDDNMRIYGGSSPFRPRPNSWKY